MKQFRENVNSLASPVLFFSIKLLKTKRTRHERGGEEGRVCRGRQAGRRAGTVYGIHTKPPDISVWGTVSAR